MEEDQVGGRRGSMWVYTALLVGWRMSNVLVDI